MIQQEQGRLRSPLISTEGGESGLLFSTICNGLDSLGLGSFEPINRRSG
jgi:hypothetical protein